MRLKKDFKKTQIKLLKRKGIARKRYEIDLERSAFSSGLTPLFDKVKKVKVPYGNRTRDRRVISTLLYR